MKSPLKVNDMTLHAYFTKYMVKEMGKKTVLSTLFQAILVSQPQRSSEIQAANSQRGHRGE